MIDSPPRVQAALEFLEHIWEAEGRSRFSDPEDGKHLTQKEEQVKDSALDLLYRYFTGEMNFGDCDPTHTGEDIEPDEPDQPVKVPN